MKKQAYMKPAMCVVKIQQQHIICTTTNGYNGRSLQMRGGSEDYQIDDEDAVW